MAGKRNETPTTDLRYPMVDLFTGGTVMPLMFVNVVTTWYVLSLTAPWLFTQAWMKELERERARFITTRDTGLPSSSPACRPAYPAR
jgi:hypothetical protein